MHTPSRCRPTCSRVIAMAEPALPRQALTSAPDRIPRPPGIHRRQELLAHGFTRSEIARHVERGHLRQLNAHWYAASEAPSDVCSALAAGARLTCVSALALAGLWAPLHQGIHVCTRRGRALPPHLALVPHRYLHSWPDREPILPLSRSLHDAAECLGADDFAVLAESGLQQRIIDRDLIAEVLSDVPARLRRQIGELDATAESGSETRVRRFLRKRGVRVRPQVHLSGIGRVDLLVGDGLIIECDSRAHHTAEQNYHLDRRRDRVAVASGFRVIRLTWEDIWLHWERTAALLSSVIARGLHRRPRPRGATVRSTKRR